MYPTSLDRRQRSAVARRQANVPRLQPPNSSAKAPAARSSGLRPVFGRVLDVDDLELAVDVLLVVVVLEEVVEEAVDEEVALLLADEEDVLLADEEDAVELAAVCVATHCPLELAGRNSTPVMVTGPPVSPLVPGLKS